MIRTALDVSDMLKDEKDIAVINARFVKPVDLDTIEYCFGNYRNIIVVEEAAANGGLGQAIGGYLATRGFRGRFESFAIPDEFIHHGNRMILLAEIGLTAENLADFIRKLNATRRTFLQKITFRKAAPTENPSRVSNGIQQKHFLK
jgi:1-deoxy-D-xylulose-5-phosphate synthase